jgi:hypothetical protein
MEDASPVGSRISKSLHEPGPPRLPGGVLRRQSADHRPLQGWDAVMAADQNHGRDANERAALNQGKTRPKLPPTQGLQLGRQSRGKQIGADQRNHLPRREPERAA